ncbi:MAG: type II toxin-antitoxin system RelE/ParE family toxin [Thermoleophilia bacterium]|nr:type II toxin-antitoxin system RelE/ParE family toxin [Thermoleophilia bacterium]
MNRRIRLHPAALQELQEAAAFYDLEGPGLGGAFLDDFERAGEQILLLPESSPIARKHARRKFMARFPYAVVYSLIDEDVFVLAVAHSRRRPFYWQDRL